MIDEVARILAIPAAHRRLNYIHPFPDGNGRVSRLMNHAMAHKAGIAAQGLSAESRGLAVENTGTATATRPDGASRTTEADRR